MLHYLRDDHGEITGLSLDVQNGQSVTIASNITFKPEGPLRHLTFGNGLSEDRTYNLNYQPESIYVGNVLNRSYEYSPDGNIINARDNFNPAYGHAASYDAIDRMVQSTGWYGVYSFTYDASGNRTSITRAGTKDTYSISTSNNYLTKTSVSAASYTYDATVNGTTGQYKYDINNQRVSKTVSGQTTLYLYDNDGRLLSEADADTGTVNREYIWLGTKPVAYLTGQQIYYIHTDNTETPQLLTNGQGNVVWTVQTYPFGKQSFAGSVTFNLRYPGQYFDQESGLHYNWHRYYDPNTGRYISSDPIGLAGGLNTYAYVGNDPLGSVDPLGLKAMWVEPSLTPVYPEALIPALRAIYFFVPEGEAASATAASNCPHSLETMINSANKADRGGLTAAGRALQKHGSRDGSSFPPAKGNPASINQQGQDVVNEIISNPNSATSTRYHARYGEVTEIRAPDGRGVRYDSEGNFMGLLEP